MSEWKINVKIKDQTFCFELDPEESVETLAAVTSCVLDDVEPSRITLYFNDCILPQGHVLKDVGLFDGAHVSAFVKTVCLFDII